VIPQRHFFFPDPQIRPKVPLDHLRWVIQAILDYKPDRIIIGGDWHDMPSLGTHDAPGSIKREGARYEDDIAAGNEAFRMMSDAIKKEQKRLKGKWNPTKDVTLGNHEYRIVRAVNNEPKYAGKMGLHDLYHGDFNVHPFLARVWHDGFCYSHFFQSEHSPHAIGGTIPNMLNKIGASFVQGHVQGAKMGQQNYACGVTRHGFVYGSCYLHDEDYRGQQRNDHFRGVLILNEAQNGDCCPMPLTLDYLCRKYEGIGLAKYMQKKYKHADKLYSVARAA
jgi:hypothetical protein